MARHALAPLGLVVALAVFDGVVDALVRGVFDGVEDALVLGVDVVVTAAVVTGGG